MSKVKSPDEFTDQQLAKMKLTRAQVTAWYQGTWTEAKIKALDHAHDHHRKCCDKCSANSKLSLKLRLAGTNRCPVAQDLLEKWSQAEMEFSWQKDFNR